MPNIDELVSKWAQERLLHGPLAVDAEAAAQVWNAVTEFRKNTPKKVEDALTAVDKWASEKFMNAPPLTHNTSATNQVNAVVADLKVRLTAAIESEAPPAPLLTKVQPQPAPDAATKE